MVEILDKVETEVASLEALDPILADPAADTHLNTAQVKLEERERRGGDNGLFIALVHKVFLILLSYSLALQLKRTDL